MRTILGITGGLALLLSLFTSDTGATVITIGVMLICWMPHAIKLGLRLHDEDREQPPTRWHAYARNTDEE